MKPRTLALIAILAACDDPPEMDLPDVFVGETTNLRVYRSESSPQVCEGQLPLWQAHTDAVARFLNADQPAEKFYVVMPDDVDKYCGDASLAGCARSPIAVGSASVIPHELTHLVAAARFGLAAPMWSEGFADAWSGIGTPLPRAPLIDSLLADESRGVNYSLASHWVQWIEQEYGAETVGALLSRSSREDSAAERVTQLEQLLGEPYEEMQSRFWREAPLYYPGFARCEGVDAVLPAKGRLELTVALDCADDPGPLPRTLDTVYTTRVLEVETTGRYSLTVDGGTSLILPCDPTDDPIEARRWTAYQYNIYNQGTAAIPNPVTLRAGRYKLWAVAPDSQPGALRITLLPAVKLSRIVP